jgi:hypothetical protein
MKLKVINSWVMDAMSTLFLIAFAVEALVRVFAMTRTAIRRALKGTDEK